MFVASYSEGEQEEPLQRNLDRTTLKFLVKTDLYRTVRQVIPRATSTASARTSSRRRPNSTSKKENSSTS